MKPRDQLYQLVEKGTELCKDPLKDCKSIEEVLIYGPFKTDLTMAKMALAKNSHPMIEHYIHKLTLHIGEPNATTQEEDS